LIQKDQKKIALAPGGTFFLSDSLEEIFDPQGEILGAGQRADCRSRAETFPTSYRASEKRGNVWANGRVRKDDVTFVVVKMK
jgi:hypothetical protein